MDTLLLTFSILGMLYTSLTLFPKLLFNFTVVTNIQMMKDKDLIFEVIKYQRHEKSKRSFRIYRSFKELRREHIYEKKLDIQDRVLRYSTKKMIEENYNLCASPHLMKLHVENINQFALLCGYDTTKEENFIMLKKGNCRAEIIDFLELVNAIEKTANDVKVDPYDVVKTMLYIKLDKKERIYIEDIKEFFYSHGGYFIESDIHDLIRELVSIQREGMLISTSEVASLIRDDIECFPR